MLINRKLFSFSVSSSPTYCLPQLLEKLFSTPYGGPFFSQIESLSTAADALATQWTPKGAFPIYCAYFPQHERLMKDVIKLCDPFSDEERTIVRSVLYDHTSYVDVKERFDILVLQAEVSEILDGLTLLFSTPGVALSSRWSFVDLIVESLSLRSLIEDDTVSPYTYSRLEDGLSFLTSLLTYNSVPPTLLALQKLYQSSVPTKIVSKVDDIKPEPLPKDKVKSVQEPRIELYLSSKLTAVKETYSDQEIREFATGYMVFEQMSDDRLPSVSSKIKTILAREFRNSLELLPPAIQNQSCFTDSVAGLLRIKASATVSEVTEGVNTLEDIRLRLSCKIISAEYRNFIQQLVFLKEHRDFLLLQMDTRYRFQFTVLKNKELVLNQKLKLLSQMILSETQSVSGDLKAFMRVIKPGQELPAEIEAFILELKGLECSYSDLEECYEQLSIDPNSGLSIKDVTMRKLRELSVDLCRSGLSACATYDEDVVSNFLDIVSLNDKAFKAHCLAPVTQRISKEKEVRDKEFSALIRTITQTILFVVFISLCAGLSYAWLLVADEPAQLLEDTSVNSDAVYPYGVEELVVPGNEILGGKTDDRQLFLAELERVLSFGQGINARPQNPEMMADLFFSGLFFSSNLTLKGIFKILGYDGITVTFNFNSARLFPFPQAPIETIYDSNFKQHVQFPNGMELHVVYNGTKPSENELGLTTGNMIYKKSSVENSDIETTHIQGLFYSPYAGSFKNATLHRRLNGVEYSTVYDAVGTVNTLASFKGVAVFRVGRHKDGPVGEVFFHINDGILLIQGEGELTDQGTICYTKLPDVAYRAHTREIQRLTFDMTKDVTLTQAWAESLIALL